MKGKIRNIILVFSLFILGSCGNKKDSYPNWAPNLIDDVNVFGERIFCNVIQYSDPGNSCFYFDESSDEFVVSDINLNCLYVTYSSNPIGVHVTATESMWLNCENGYSTIIVADFLPEYRPFRLDSFANEVEKNKGYSTSVITNYVTQKTYNFPTQMCQSRVYHNSDDEILQRFSYPETIAAIDSVPVAIRYLHPNGSSLIFVSMPLLFTNYGVLYEENAEFIIDLFRLAGGHSWRCCFHSNEKVAAYYDTNPSIKNQSTYNDHSKKQLLRQLIEYAIIAAFISFLIFAARRRERIIPVIERPKNRSVDFAKQISKNYMWKEEYGIILRKKFVIFIDTLREKANINLNDQEHFSSNIAILEKLTQENKLDILISNLFKIQENKSYEVSYENMKYHITKMNLIISKLK